LWPRRSPWRHAAAQISPGATPSNGSAQAVTTSTVLPTSTVPKVTGQQLASKIAADVIKYREYVASEASCSSIDCLVLENQIPRWKRMVEAAQRIGFALENSVPPELGAVVTTTKAAGDALEHAWNAWMLCLDRARDKGGTRQDCDAEESAAEEAWRAFGSALDAWRPYGIQ
jgi:hypothetical protein